MSLHEISISEVKLNPFEEIGKNWFLVTSGDENSWNTMTAGWGLMGTMWGKDVFDTVVRHNRYTYEFMEKNDLFTISFFDDDKKDVVKYCGSHSGRDTDKAAGANITPKFVDGTTIFEEAKLVFVCKKLYTQDLDLNLLNKDDAEKWYSKDPIHKQYIGEIFKVYSK